MPLLLQLGLVIEDEGLDLLGLRRRHLTGKERAVREVEGSRIVAINGMAMGNAMVKKPTSA